ncbi:MAG: hypothetical protein BWY87_00821 [Deltaproteobacteria bacterium ADurb.Bin510]|nr:MAG: hypothetical protein BWY87_00821 [Deltaproteobacteria bacterium ADurb.Bin510]
MDVADDFTGVDQLDALLAADAQALVGHVQVVPLLALEVDRPVADHHAGRVLECAGEFEAEPARDLHELVGAREDLGLVLADPDVERALAGQLHGFEQAGHPEHGSSLGAQGRRVLVLALIEPDHGRPERLAFFVDREDRGALGRDAHAQDVARVDLALDVLHQLVGAAAELGPVVAGVGLAPAGLLREVGLVLMLADGDFVALVVEEHGAHALGAAVEGDEIFSGGHADLLGLFCWKR